MLSRKARALTRLATAAGVVALGTAGFAGMAQASTGQIAKANTTITNARSNGGVTKVKIAGSEYEKHVQLTDGSVHPTVLFNLRLPNGSMLHAYCIDIHHPSSTGYYDEGSWTTSNVPNLDKVQWILSNSFPTITAAQLAHDAGVTGTLSAQDAVEGTQAAIWHFSDSATPKTQSSDNDAAVLAIYRYLTGSANTGASEPLPTLSITPTSVQAALTTSKSDQLVGPFTIATTAASGTVKLSLGDAPAGVRLTNASGTPVTTVGNGDKVYFDLPAGTAAASAHFSATAPATISTGRVFLAENGANTYQKLILVGTSLTTVSAAASATWSMTAPTPSQTPTPVTSTTPAGVSLAHTGADNTPMIIGIVVALLVVGGGLVFFVRRRARTTTES